MNTKKITIFFIIFSFFSINIVNAQSFTDVSSSHKNYEAIETLKKYGIIQGYADGTFKPENTINRAESLKIILKGSGIETPDTNSNGGFSDVPISEWFTPFVVKAKNLGIIKGNPDGNFLPENNLNLAESLKILLLTNGIHVSQISFSEKPYDDIELNQWFAPYFTYASEKNLIDKKKYEKVIPGHAVTRAELAEIMYRLRNILEVEQRDISFASYYSDTLHGNNTASGEKYDKNKFTAAHRELPFGTKVEVTNMLNGKSVLVKINDRGPNIEGRIIDLSKVAFEAISPLSKGIIPISLRVVDDNPTANPVNILPFKEDCIWPEDVEEIDTKHFINKEENIHVELYEPLKTKYFENEIIDISGKVFDDKIKEITAFLKDEKGNQHTFLAEVKSGNFLVQVNMGEVGKKQFSIIQERSGSNYTANIEVFSIECDKNLPESNLQAPSNYRFAIENNIVIFRWENNDANISRVTFKQGDKEIIQYFSKKKKGWKINPKLFNIFSQGEFSVNIETAQSNSGTILGRTSKWKNGDNQTYIATLHHHSIEKPEYIQISNFTNTYGFGGEISFNGRTKSHIRHEAAIIKPSGKIETISLNTQAKITENQHGIKTISPNEDFYFLYKPTEHGSYIIEINHESGIAALNTPIYEEGKIPIIPDFVDLKLGESHKELGDINTNTSSVELLNLINQERLSSDIDRLELTDGLSFLAQERANDMAKNNYLSHWTQSGQDINDLRISHGIKTSIGENIAKESNLINAHLGLMRSALHRDNILSKHWTKAGFGFSKSQDGQIIVVELFSSNPIEEKDIPNLREDVLDIINSQREKFLIPNASLNAISQSWSDTMVTEDFFPCTECEIVSPSGVSLTNNIRKSGILQTVGTFLIGDNSWINLRENLIKNLKKTSPDQIDIFDNNWKEVGIGISQDNDGIIKVTLLYSE